MKKAKIVALIMSVAMVVPSMPAVAYAEDADTLSYEGYSEVFVDDFDGDELNGDNWNVELHEKGWVNSELQEYVDSDENIFLNDGNLYLNPVKKSSLAEIKGNLIINSDFATGSIDNWAETIANWGGEYVTVAGREISDNKVIYTIENPGTEDWHVQLKQTGIALEGGKTYTGNIKLNTNVARMVKIGVQSASYAYYGGGDYTLDEGDNTITFDFTMSESDDNATFYISMGYCGDVEAEDFPEGGNVISISDIELKDANEAEAGDTEEVISYTSGRISTQNKQTFTYGLFEARAKVPSGQGFLPAFWLMANDENIYGQWPRCGEIDCMEVMGQDTSKLYGTIHYGNPHSESQGTYTVTEGADFAEDFHLFQCEWEPGKIKWYVDGKLYHEEDDWYSTTEGLGTLTYPAPFDQPFYIILNLAVGGSWVGNPDDSTSFENNPYVIDYVKVYQKDSYDENVSRPTKEIIIREPEDGNYINNGVFTVDEDLTDDVDWKFMTTLGGEATAEIKHEGEASQIVISTTDEGTVDYSVQLVQAGIPLVKGAKYKVSFDACASGNREMGVDIKAPDKGYRSYMDHKTASLTTEVQTYTYEFKMTGDTDANARLEYNMGAANSTETISIGNVSIVKTEDPDPDEKEIKTVLSNGNYIYNGGFSEGDAHLGYWTVASEGEATYSVTNFSDGRRFKAQLGEGASLSLTQDELAFYKDEIMQTDTPYTFSMDVESDVNTTVNVNVGGNDYDVDVVAGKENYSIKIPAGQTIGNGDVVIALQGPAQIYIDNVKLVESALIKNGSFNDNTTGYEIYVDSSAKATYVVDSLAEDNALSVTVNKTGDADWKVQIKQNNVPLVNGQAYRLDFKAKSTRNRNIRAIMQGLEDKGWPVYSSTEDNNDGIFELTNEYKNYSVTFVMTADTDPNAFLSICLGKIDEEINDLHTVVIDDISLTEVEISEEEPEPVIYTVNFDARGGKASKSKITVEEGMAVGKLPSATRANYTFEGWFTKAVGGTKITDKTVITNDVTFYAHWVENTYKISYVLNGGKNSSANPTKYKYSTPTIKLASAKKTGYKFAGWYSDKKLTKKVTQIKKGSSGNITLYAKWTPIKYTVKYNANGGKGSMKSQSYTYGKSQKLRSNTYKKTGYKFAGWATSKANAKKGKVAYKNKTSVKNLTSKDGKTITLYAVWKKNK